MPNDLNLAIQWTSNFCQELILLLYELASPLHIVSPLPKLTTIVFPALNELNETFLFQEQGFCQIFQCKWGVT